MRGKIAKRLRRRAESETKGRPAVAYVAKDHGTRVVSGSGRTVEVLRRTLRLDGGTRRRYIDLKRQYARRGRHG